MDAQQNSNISLLMLPIGPQTSSPELFSPCASCPNCGKGKLDYNGLLELECPGCGIRFGGGAGCT